MFRDSNAPDEILTDYIVTGGLDDLVKVWEMRNDRLELKHTLEGHSLGVFSVAISNNGKCKLSTLLIYSRMISFYFLVCASSSLDSSMRIWDLERGEKTASMEVGPVDLWTVVFSPDDKYIISGSHSGKITLYDVETAKAEQSLETGGKFTLSIAYVNQLFNCLKHEIHCEIFPES